MQVISQGSINVFWPWFSENISAIRKPGSYFAIQQNGVKHQWI